MLSDDYIIRMISQAATVFARIIGLKKAGDYQDALEEIDHNLEQLLGPENRINLDLDEESLQNALKENEKLNLERIRVVADLLKEEGEIFGLQGKLPESNFSYSKSLSLYLLIDGHPDPAHPMEVSSRINELIQKTDLSGFTGKTLFELFCYFENNKKYARAEGVLNLLAARPETRVDAFREMKLFYERMAEKDQSELDSQGMNLKKIQARLKEIR